MSTSPKVWIVYAESGEYSDHGFRVLGVAKSEVAARVAVEKFAREAAEKETYPDWPVVARPTRPGDDWHPQESAYVFWTVTRPDEDGDEYRARTDDTVFGYHESSYVPEGA